MCIKRNFLDISSVFHMKNLQDVIVTVASCFLTSLRLFFGNLAESKFILSENISNDIMQTQICDPSQENQDELAGPSNY
jgi:hypothetical protein